MMFNKNLLKNVLEKRVYVLIKQVVDLCIINLRQDKPKEEIIKSLENLLSEYRKNFNIKDDIDEN